MVRAAGVEDVTGFDGLCLFEHFYKGYLVGPADWHGGGFLPCAPGATIPEAIRNWDNQLQERVKSRG